MLSLCPICRLHVVARNEPCVFCDSRAAAIKKEAQSLLSRVGQIASEPTVNKLPTVAARPADLSKAAVSQRARRAKEPTRIIESIRGLAVSLNYNWEDLGCRESEAHDLVFDILVRWLEKGGVDTVAALLGENKETFSEEELVGTAYVLFWLEVLVARGVIERVGKDAYRTIGPVGVLVT